MTAMTSRCYLQRYPDDRGCFCKPSQLMSECMLSVKSWTSQTLNHQNRQHSKCVGHPAGRQFGCNTHNGRPLTFAYEAVTSLKVVVPGHGSPPRTETLYNSLTKLRDNMPTGVAFSCVVFVYRDHMLLTKLSQLCRVVWRKGMWTDFMKLEPLIGGNSSSHVLLMMDDVFPFNLDLPTMLYTMERHRVDVLSPAILPRWNWKYMNQGDEGHLLKHTGYVDMLFVLFKRTTWNCWLSLIDVEANRPGWGYDVSLGKRCNASIAISDQHLVLHTTGAGGSQERSYNNSAAFEAMWHYLRDVLRWEFRSKEKAMKALIANNNAPPSKFVRGPPLSLLDPKYFNSQASHRGGWITVMQHLLRTEVLSINNRGDQPYLIDVTEMWFVWEHGKPLLEPWVGMIHTTLNLPIRYRQDNVSTLWALLANKAFNRSLVWCGALIVFSKYLATDLRRLLPNVPVVTMKHPIGMTDMERASVSFSMSAFRARQQRRKVIFLGSQYRRLATLEHLQVPLKKLWLPGISTRVSSKIEFARRYFLETGETAADISSFRIQYTKTYQEFDDLLLHNIVVIDVLDASANNAVLEAIGMNNPVHMTNHPAITEYVGRDYPLLFDNITSLESLLNDSARLMHGMRMAHLYLKGMPKQELSLDFFAKTLEHASQQVKAQIFPRGRVT